mmetsp:Transcript_25495/g.38758  ORF Transcript_25495/g.38758 Transcript_25495/m.38758 type:complete len:99 (-) Transcript_25495:92-388(-)
MDRAACEFLLFWILFQSFLYVVLTSVVARKARLVAGGSFQNPSKHHTRSSCEPRGRDNANEAAAGVVSQIQSSIQLYSICWGWGVVALFELADFSCRG